MSQPLATPAGDAPPAGDDAPTQSPADDDVAALPAELAQPPASAMSVRELIHELHAGRRRADDLPAELRQLCVEHLTAEGFTNDEIVRLLGVSERTVRRDRDSVRRLGGLKPDLYLGDELLGEFERITHASIARLIRLARDPDTPAYARLWAEEAVSRTYQRLIETARRISYLDTGERRLDYQRDTDPTEQRRRDAQRYLNRLRDKQKLREALDDDPLSLKLPPPPRTSSIGKAIDTLLDSGAPG